MAKGRNPKLAAVEKEYRRVRKNYLQYLSRAKKQGLLLNTVGIAKPKRITQGSINRLNKEYEKIKRQRKEEQAKKRASEVELGEIVEEYINDAIDRAKTGLDYRNIVTAKKLEKYITNCIRQFGKAAYYKALANSPSEIIAAVDYVLDYKPFQTSDGWAALNQLIYEAAKKASEGKDLDEIGLGKNNFQPRDERFNFHIHDESEATIRNILFRRGFSAQEAEIYIDNEFND